MPKRLSFKHVIHLTMNELYECNMNKCTNKNINKSLHSDNILLVKLTFYNQNPKVHSCTVWW